MQIKRIDYPKRDTKKYEVIENNQKYICYINCWNGNNVFDENNNNITDTKLGMEIILECGRQ